MTTAVEMSRGPVAVREAVESYLKGAVPGLIDQARISWNLNDRTLPYPKLYDAWDPWEVQEYPVVGAYVQRARNFTRMNNDSISKPYRPLYSLQVAVWAEDPRFDGIKFRDPSPQGATRVANDLTTVLRVALLEFPNLEQPEIFTFEEDTYSEEYIPATKVTLSEDNWVAAGLLSFSMHVNEGSLLSGSSLGIVEAADLFITRVAVNDPMEELV